MPCTTILIGKKASYDGSTIVARNEDSPGGQFEPKKMHVVLPGEQPRRYRSVESHVEIELPDDPMRYTSVPDAIPGHGVWAAAGFNEANVAMSATETITSNPRVLGADPLVEYRPAQGAEGEDGYVPERVGGIGEEDMVTLVLPYVRSAREGVLRLGELLERFGTYEMNGIAFSDADEIWWMETIGGHRWIAKRVPDDAYVTMPNQLGIDSFDLVDAETDQREHMASADMRAWMREHHLKLDGEPLPARIPFLFQDEVLDLAGVTLASEDVHRAASTFNPRLAFGSHSDSDHVYNTPRAWYMQRCLNPSDAWDGPAATYGPESDDIPWSRVPEHRLTIEDVKYVLSSHYQGTEYDPYGKKGDAATRSLYRPIGINRNGQLAVLQIRPDKPEGCRCVQWMAFGSNAFNALVPLYTNVGTMPEYLSNTTGRVTSESFYWANRIIAALADARFHDNSAHIERYCERIGSRGHAMLIEADRAVAELCGAGKAGDVSARLEAANERMAEELKRETEKLLASVLYTTSLAMKNSFAMSDN